MRKIIYLLLAVSCFVSTAMAQEARDESIRELTKDFVNYEQGQLSAYQPIQSFNEIAAQQAKKTITLTPENMAEALTEAKAYDHCVITVGSHTLVVVSSFDKTIASGAWATKMPYCVGYISKGTLQKREDYLNNIIGIPDGQTRTMFLF